MTSINKCCDDSSPINKLSLLKRQSIKTIIEKEGFESYIVDVNDISTNGGNYLGTLQTVSIQGKCKDGDEKEINLFLKNIVTPDENFTILNPSMLYFREGFIYNDVLKLVEKIEDKFKIPQEDRLNVVKSYSETNSELIILEDVSKTGFKTYDRCDVVPIQFAKLAIEQLAKLHAISFVMQHEHPKYFENKIKPLHTMFNFTTEFEMHIRKCCDKAMDTLDGDVKTKIDNFYSKIIEKFPIYFSIPADEGICLIHGDFRPNNVLLKEIDGQVIKVMPVDYQLAQYGYPIIDFIFFIFLATDQKFRKDHLENLKDFYYSTFENFLAIFDIEANEVYSKKKFEEEYRNKLDFGLMCFLATMPFIFAKIDDIPKFEKGLQDASFNLDECYKDRLRGIVDDFLQWGYL